MMQMLEQGSRLSVCVAAMVLFVFANQGIAQKKRYVEIEVVVSRQAPVETQQQWMKLLTDVGADRVRSKTSRYGAKVKVSENESSTSIRVKVEGAIQGGKLVLPGQSFSMRDKAALTEYVAQLKTDGAEIALSEKKAFGLTSKQLVAVNEALKHPLKSETTGQTASKVVGELMNQLSLRVKMDASAKRAFARSEPIEDELKDFSAGTALAAVARPLGLVMVPKRIGSEISLHLIDYTKADEHWPIGWPAPAIPKRMVPRLFDKFPIEVREFPLDQVLNAIQTRSKVPMLFDYNSMARAGIDLSKTNVTFAKKSSYAHALGKVLNQATPRMDYEIRVDENGRPFLWITTANPIR